MLIHYPSTEFLISDLALSSHAIPSITLTSKALLSPFLDHHPPSTIITDAEFLPHLLELIYDTNEGSHYTVIVHGELPAKLSQGLGQVHIVKWDDIERQGANLQQVPASSPGESRHPILP